MTSSAELPLRYTPVRELMGHRGPVHGVVFNSDGKYCLSVGHDRTVKLWNPHKDAPEDPVLAAALAGAGGSTSFIRSAALSAGRAAQGLLVRSYDYPGNKEVLDVAVSGDSARFAAVGGDKVAFVFDVTSGNILRRISGHQERINAVELNPKGSADVLFTGSYDGTVRVWDLRASSVSSRAECEGREMQVFASPRSALLSVRSDRPNYPRPRSDGRSRR